MPDASGLIGRDRELRLLTDMIDSVRDEGAALVVVGDPGVGKTSLLRAAAAHGKSVGSTVLSVVGVEAEVHLPFAGLHQLLRPVLAETHRLPTPQRDALHAAFGMRLSDAADGGAPELFMIGLATLNVLTDVAARQPLLVVVDDVQWLDRPTQDVLGFVARRIGSDPCALIGVVRAGHDIAFAAADLPQLNLGRLAEQDARELLHKHAADLGYADRERILREAAGNPLALTELPLALRSASRLAAEYRERPPQRLQLTARLERAFAARLGDLPPLCQDALLVAAVDDTDDLREIIAGATILAGQPARIAVLEDAVAAGLIRFDDFHAHFRHPLVRAAIINKESVARKQAAHEALAEVLAGEPYRRIWHRAQSVDGQDDEVADEMERAHTIPLRRGSVSEVIWALERSAELTTDSATRGRRLMLAAEHSFGLGRADLVDQLLERAGRTSLSRLDQVRMQWLREIFHDGVPGDAGHVLTLCEAAQEAIDAGDSTLALNLLQAAGLRCWWADTGPAARVRVCEVARRIERPPGDAQLTAIFSIADPLGEYRTVAESLAAVRLEGISDPAELWLYGMAAAATADPVRSVDFLGRAEIVLRQQGRLGLLSQVLTMSVIDSMEIGDWEHAWAASEEGRRLAVDTGQVIWDAGSQALYAMLLALRGDHEQALAIAAEVERSTAGRRLSNLLACGQLARGFAHLSAGRHADAYRALRRLFDPDDPAFHVHERFHGVSFLAEAAVRAGRADEVRTVIADLEAEAVTVRSPILVRQLTYARAVLAPDDTAEEAFLAALSADLTRWPWLQARLELAFGQWLRRQRRVAEARRPLHSAQLTFDLIGARSWSEATRIELRAAGGRSPAAAEQPTGLASLTAQELQIARLAAQGLSNKEIGERLYLSHRTVGSHLYRIFPKLDVSTRAQLATLLGAREAAGGA
ncbi:AAA family ATPase [Streptacidiphilus sp. P02-A3a]|uniref:AAA family ATPase n=1 Tax=Streptacidiphilus sp. P02-A3a TaxID=2704468 RepID=UPI0015F92DC4|nr:LuxR family transcriptional regulator [Streptacidiphilus sp. P02-A3a]QMU73036.1 AAA family ATPase [Streptacidiphilus sp. P02-A3a]